MLLLRFQGLWRGTGVVTGEPWRRKWQFSSILAWRIPWTEELGGLQSMGSQSWTRLSDYNTHTHSHTHSLSREPDLGFWKSSSSIGGFQHHFKLDWGLGRGAQPMAANKAELQGTLLGGKVWTHVFSGQILHDVSWQLYVCLMSVCVCVCMLCHVRLFAIPGTVAS